MSERDPKPSLKELHDRLSKIESSLEALDSAFRKALKVYADFDKNLMEHCLRHDEEFSNAWDRIKNLEYAVFPNLARDIEALHNIIGEGEDWRKNPLDTRRKFPWDDPKNRPSAS